MITVEAYQNAQVHTITAQNKEFFEVKMKDVQDKLGIKNITQHVKDELRSKFETNKLAKEKKQQYLRSEYQIMKVETNNKKDKVVKNKLIEKIIKNCRGVKKCNDGINRLDKENQRQNFKTILDLKKMKYMKEKNTQ